MKNKRLRRIVTVISVIAFVLSILKWGTLTLSYGYVDASVGGSQWLAYVGEHIATFYESPMAERVFIAGREYRGKKYDTPYGTLYDMYFYDDNNKVTGNLMVLFGDLTYSYIWNIYQLDEDKHSYVLIFSDNYGNGIYKALSYLASANMYVPQSTSQVSLGGNYKLLRNSQGHLLSPYEYSADNVYGPIKKYSVVFPYINANISSCKGEKNIGFSGGIKVLPFVNIRNSQEEYKVVGVGLFIRDDMTQALMSEYASAYGVSYLSPQLVGFSSMNISFGVYKNALLGFIGWATDRDSKRFWNPTVHSSGSLDWIGALSGVVGGLNFSPPVNILVSVVGNIVQSFSRSSDYYTEWHVDSSTGKMELLSNEFLPILLSDGNKIDNRLWNDLRYVPNTAFVPIYASYDMGTALNHVVEVSGTIWLHVASKIYWQGSGHSACTAVISAPIYVNMRYRVVD